MSTWLGLQTRQRQHISCTTHKVHHKILEVYKKLSPNEILINIKAPPDKNNNPELDNTELCNEEQITKIHVYDRSPTEGSSPG